MPSRTRRSSNVCRPLFHCAIYLRKVNFEGAEHRAGAVQGTLSFFCIRGETVIGYSLYCSSCSRHQPPRRRTQNSILSAINNQRMLSSGWNQLFIIFYLFPKTAERPLSWFRSSDKRLKNRGMYECCSRARTLRHDAKHTHV